MATERSVERRIGLDTNVLAYAFTESSLKAQQAEALLGQRPWISVQALNELVGVLQRKRALSWTEIDTVVETISALCVVADLTSQAHRVARQLTRRYPLRWWDALQVAVALDGGATTFFSEDVRDGLLVEGRLRIVNPFAAAAS